MIVVPLSMRITSPGSKNGMSPGLAPSPTDNSPSVTMICPVHGVLKIIAPLSCLVTVIMPQVKGGPPSSLPNISRWCTPFFTCWRLETFADAFLYTETGIATTVQSRGVLMNGSSQRLLCIWIQNWGAFFCRHGQTCGRFDPRIGV